MDYEDVNDPANICEDITGKGKWGNGNVQISLTPDNMQLRKVMAVIKQSFDKHMESV